MSGIRLRLPRGGCVRSNYRERLADAGDEIILQQIANLAPMLPVYRIVNDFKSSDFLNDLLYAICYCWNIGWKDKVLHCDISYEDYSYLIHVTIDRVPGRERHGDVSLFFHGLVSSKVTHKVNMWVAREKAVEAFEEIGHLITGDNVLGTGKMIMRATRNVLLEIRSD